MVIGATGFTPAFITANDDKLQSFMAGLDAVRGAHPSMTVGMLYLLLSAAEYYDIHYMQKKDMGALAEHLGIPYSTLTRQVELLGEGVARRGGLGLVEKEHVPGSNKRKLVRVTEDGRRVMVSIIAAMNESERRRAAIIDVDGAGQRSLKS